MSANQAIMDKWPVAYWELTLSTSFGETILRGELPDMSAFYGVISRLGSLVIALVSVRCVEEEKMESIGSGG